MSTVTNVAATAVSSGTVQKEPNIRRGFGSLTISTSPFVRRGANGVTPVMNQIEDYSPEAIARLEMAERERANLAAGMQDDTPKDLTDKLYE